MRKPMFLLLVSFFLVGCNVPRERNICETITVMRGLTQGERSSEDMHTQLATLFDLSTDKVLMDKRDDQYYFQWANEKLWGNLSMQGTHPLRGGFGYNGTVYPFIGMRYRVEPPSANAVISCLGKPDKYRANYRWPPPGAGENYLVVARLQMILRLIAPIASFGSQPLPIIFHLKCTFSRAGL